MGKRITALSAQKHNPQRVNVFLDGDFAFGLERIVAAWLQVGQELSEEKIARLQAEDGQEAAYQKALRFIGYRERSEVEVQQYLKDQKLPEETADEILARLRNNGLVNDQRFAQTWVENRTEFRPRSRRALAYELKQKGIDNESIQSALEEVDDETLAYEAAVKQARKYTSLDWPDFRQKMYAFLGRRGFSFSNATQAVARVWAEVQAGRERDAFLSDNGTPDEEVGS